MILPAPAMAAPLTHDSPTPPQPTTATVLPGSTLAVWNTAPTPVITPQPTRAARSSGMSSRTFTSACSCTTICSANEDRLANWAIGSSPFLRRPRDASGPLTSGFSHSDMWPVRHGSQWPQNTDRQVIT